MNEAALMFGWYVGRRLRRNVIREISVAQKTMIPTAQVAVATEIVQRMALVEIAKGKGGDAGVLRATQAVLRQATTDRHKAPSRGEAWVAASLVESWTSAKLNALNGRIPERSFDKVDKEVWRFVNEAIGAGTQSELRSSS